MTNEQFKELCPTAKAEEDYYVAKVMECLNYFEVDEDFSDKGVRDNVITWLKNSEGKFEMLRKHPNWNEEAKAVVFLADEEREVDRYAYREAFYKLNDFIGSFAAPSWKQQCLLRYLKDSIDVGKLIPEECARLLNEQYGQEVKAGTKLSRYIQKVFKNYETETDGVIDATNFKKETEIWVTVGDHQETRTKVTSFNSLYAALADTINPLKITRITVFSANILDFLTMSNGNSWASCHYINSHGLFHSGQSHYSGCYKAGTLSYALDENSYILYTLPKEYEGDEWWKEQKLTRTIFAYRDDVLLQSRLYPQDNDGQNSSKKTEYRNLVQKIISDCEEKPNFWNAPITDTGEIRDYVRTGDGALQYEDYFYDNYNPRISVRKLDYPKAHGRMVIGHVPYCVNCGDEITDAEHLACDYCAPGKYVCANCGERMSEDEAIWDEYRDEYYCSDCVHWCEYHERYEFEDDCNNEVKMKYGYGWVCDQAVDYGYYCYCEDCGYYFSCDDGKTCIDDLWRCYDCADQWDEENTSYCEDCEELFMNEDLIRGDDGKYRCRECHDEYLKSLEEPENETEIQESENEIKILKP